MCINQYRYCCTFTNYVLFVMMLERMGIVYDEITLMLSVLLESNVSQHLCTEMSLRS